MFRHLLASTPCEDAEAELRRLGYLIDLSQDFGSPDGILKAQKEATAALESSGTDDHRKALLHYFLSNASEVLRTLSRSGWELHEWEQPELAQQIIHLRYAARLGNGTDLPVQRLCQIFTNLGNLMNHCGRVVEAMAAWDAALELDPEFVMALGNRGYGLRGYAQLTHDIGHKVCLVREAYRSLVKAQVRQDLSNPPAAMELFARIRREIEESVSKDVLSGEIPTGPFDEDWTTEERVYREWCLGERLFLNDLNDIDLGYIAAADVVTLPSITTPVEASQPSWIGFFNQLKQEFVSARFFYYSGTSSDESHFSDKEVTLVNTLDYASYGLNVENVKVAFRLAYSLLDKIAYFLNDYLELGIPERRVSFRGLWYRNGQPVEGVRAELADRRNLGLKGLFWLAKDLYEPTPEFAEAIEPEAAEIASIRNHLEHKYLKLHENGPPTRGPYGIGFEELAHSVGRREFDAKALRLLKLSRAALLYLSHAIYAEEYRRSPSEENGVVAPMFLDKIEDEWKF